MLLVINPDLRRLTTTGKYGLSRENQPEVVRTPITALSQDRTERIGRGSAYRSGNRRGGDREMKGHAGEFGREIVP